MEPEAEGGEKGRTWRSHDHKPVYRQGRDLHPTTSYVGIECQVLTNGLGPRLCECVRVEYWGNGGMDR